MTRFASAKKFSLERVDETCLYVERRESFRHQDEIGLGANFNRTVLLRISWTHCDFYWCARLPSWPKCQVRAAEGPNILTSGGMDQDGRPIMSGLGRAFGSDIWIHQLVFMMSRPSKHQQFVCEHVPFRLLHCWSGQHHWNHWQIWHMARHLGVLDLPFWGTTKNLVCSQCVGADIYKGEMGTSRSLGMFPSLPLQISSNTLWFEPEAASEACDGLDLGGCRWIFRKWNSSKPSHCENQGEILSNYCGYW